MRNFTFYWHDYETFGANPSRDRPSQFAGIRTDQDFNIIGEPLVIYCKPAADVLPHPDACLITGITPQHAFKHGVNESEFIRLIHEQLSQSNTCGVGYNSIRFDDEVTRYTLYRNFYDAYAREWQNGNSRWDIIDMARVCRALRPEGINWPDHADGTPSFKLEDITAANNISHDAAHDALSDVYATIAVAKLIKEKQPKLFDYVLQLRDKRKVGKLLDVVNKKPVLHTSGMFSASQFCTAMVIPLVVHPTNKNGVIAYDLAVDPSPLIELSAEQIRGRLYTASDRLPDGVERIALKTIHVNRSPVVVTTKLLDDAVSDRIQLDISTARKNYQQLMNAEGIEEKLTEVFLHNDLPTINDPDIMLYSGGFFGSNDKNTMTEVRRSSPEELRGNSFHFEDNRLPEMLFRYRARNFPETLTDEERLQWQEYCYHYLTDPESGASIILENYINLIDSKLANEDLSDRDKVILHALLNYADEILS